MLILVNCNPAAELYGSQCECIQGHTTVWKSSDMRIVNKTKALKRESRNRWLPNCSISLQLPSPEKSIDLLVFWKLFLKNELVSQSDCINILGKLTLLSGKRSIFVGSQFSPSNIWTRFVGRKLHPRGRRTRTKEGHWWGFVFKNLTTLEEDML